MSGHSKWSTIKRKKAAVDAKRSKLWTKAIKEVTVAARIGGSDPASNSRLRLAIDKARQVNMPKDSIKRAIERASGPGSGASWEEVVYEGYGPGGVAVVVECMTDNRNRTVSEVRHSFEKYGGSMGQSGSVSWLFHKRGIIHVLKADAKEEQLMEVALEAGAEDIRDEGEVWTIETAPGNFFSVKESLESKAVSIANAEVDNVPDTKVDLGDDRAASLVKMLHSLEDLDDVQNVYANCDISDQLLERLGG